MSGSEPFARIENRKNIGSFLAILKPNYFKKQRSLSSLLINKGKLVKQVQNDNRVLKRLNSSIS